MRMIGWLHISRRWFEDWFNFMLIIEGSIHGSALNASSLGGEELGVSM